MRILFVAMADSVHTARWIGQLQDCSWDVHLFPCEDGNIHTGFRGVTIHPLLRQSLPDMHPSVRQTGIWWPFRRGRTRLTQLIRGCGATRAAMLIRTIRNLKPDVIHTLEMQRAGYLTLESRCGMDVTQFPPWIFSSWGSDIYHFGRQLEHEPRIRQVLGACDYFAADCLRDSILSGTFGFRGCNLGVFPGGGGFEIDRMQQVAEEKPSSRKIIAVKGYQSETWGGRALIALQAIKSCAEILGDYRIVVFSAHGNPEVCSAVEGLSHAGLSVTVLPQSSHEEIVELMGKARIALGLSITDGTPNAMLEAMIMGAFPIQSDTASTTEWIEDGQNGFLVPPENSDAVATAICNALADDALVNRAAEMNDHIARTRVDMSVIKPRVLEMYEKVVVRSRRPNSHEQRGLCAS
jgi:Glycosyl transferase 4-like/Glycosyl transferases group 1